MEQGCELPATKPHTPSEWELDPGLAERPGMDPMPGMEAGAAGEELGLSGKCPHNQAWLCCRQEQKEEEEEEEGTCLTAAGQWRLLEPPSLGGWASPGAPSPAGPGGLWFVSRVLAGGRRAQSCDGEGQQRDGILSAPALRGWGSGPAGREGIGPCPRRAGGTEGMGRRGRRDRVQPGTGSGATLGRVCEGIGLCPGVSAP